MAQFLCRVADERGKVFTQVETAASEAEVRRRMAEKGLFVYSIRGRTLPSLSLQLPGISKGKISTNQFLLFNQQFVTLIRAGLPILRALDLLADRSSQPRLKELLNEVRERIRGGASLSEAFRAQGMFPEVYTSSLLALLIIVAGLVLSYVTLEVIPKFSQLYKEMNVDLPPITVAVVTVAENLRASIFVFLVLVGAAVVGIFLFTRSAGGAQAIDRARMRIPLIGDVVLKFRLAQFCRTLSTLLGGGIPLVPSLEVASGAMVSPVLRHTVAVAANRVSEGQSLHAALSLTDVFPELVTEMIEVGENTGALPQMLESVAEFYEEELNSRLAMLLTLVEPLLLLVMGGLVLTILVALYLPIFSVGAVMR
jgi:type IV pilus assembly protein PilC